MLAALHKRVLGRRAHSSEYVEMRQRCRAGIATAIMAPRVFRHESLPSGPTWDEVRKAIDAVAGDKPTAIRDRAICGLRQLSGAIMAIAEPPAHRDVEGLLLS